MSNARYKFAARPTEYNGIVFRSRLEATWAAFFDLTGWKWKYEPHDLEHWMPDFEISHENPTFRDYPVLVEVKPTWEMFDDVVDKIRKSGVDSAVFLANGPEMPTVTKIGGEDIMFDGGKTGDCLGVEYSFEHEIPVTFDPRFMFNSQAYWAQATNATRWKP